MESPPPYHTTTDHYYTCTLFPILRHSHCVDLKGVVCEDSKHMCNYSGIMKQAYIYFFLTVNAKKKKSIIQEYTT